MPTRKRSKKTKARKKSAAPEINLALEFPEFQGRLKQAMADSGLNLAQLAIDAQISRPTTHRIASLEGNPLLTNLIHISRCVGVSVPDLLGQQRGVRVPSTAKTPRGMGPLLGLPPRPDPIAFGLYEALCRGVPIEEVREEAEQLRYPMAGEETDDSLSRAVLDVFNNNHVWVDASKLPRARTLERKLTKKYNLAAREELADESPVRVVDTAARIFPLIQLHAVAALGASLVKELLYRYSRLGFADGFMSSTVQMFLRRGDLNKTELVPLVVSPHFAQFELSGATLIGSLARSHQGYRVRSSVALQDLSNRVDHVEVAVTSCGSSERESRTRLARLIRAGGESYTEFLQKLKKHRVVGDLMYHFLRANGKTVDFPNYSQDIEKLDVEKLDVERMSKPGATAEKMPLVYTASLKSLADIAERGVSMLLLHSPNRAPVVHAALQRKRRTANLLVMTKAAAQRLAEL